MTDPCRLIACLSWYEESPAWLAATIASLRGCVDHLVALDGPYALFPQALSYPRSGREQAETIVETAYACNIGLTLVSPREPWLGNEVEKRNALFRYALLAAEPNVDWLFCLDADEVVTRYPPDLRQRLADAEEDVAGVWFWQRTAEHPLPADGAPHANPRELREGFGGHRVLMRALPDIRVEEAHYYYVAGPEDDPTVLRGRPDLHYLAPCLEIPDMKVEHRNPAYRQPARHRAKHAYYETRDRLLIERPVIGARLERLDGGISRFDANGERVADPA